MPNDLKLIDVDEIGNVLTKLEDAYFDIPFENSDFQNKAFVMASQQTPARAYRAIGLRMFAKIRAIKEYMIQEERNKIDIEEKEAKMADPDTSPFDKRRLKLDIIALESQKKWGEKLLNDALRELSCLHQEFQKFPTYTRETFEREEEQHFNAKLTRSLKAQGAMESLMNMHEDFPNFDQRIQLALAKAPEALPKQ